jgi:hypothetical protein
MEFGEVRVSEFVVLHPAAPAEEESTYGGFAEIARQINARHPERGRPISRQLVERWYKCRGANEFPERRNVEVGGKTKPLFNLDEVMRWHARWLRERSTEDDPTLGTIPLFDVSPQGHPIDREASAYRGHPQVRESSYRSSILDL